MHLVVSKVESGRKTYHYARLVRSYRRSDGKPAQKVLANLGQLSPQMVENLRAALQAAREGKPVVVGKEEISKIGPTRVRSNYEYLDVAAALAMWDRWELTPLLDSLLSREQDDVSPGAVVAAMVLHRCLRPGSKLHAVSWYAKTALPELLGISPSQFNNSRLHRVLDALDSAGEQLQEELPRRHRERRGVAAALFLDVTDAWFEGRGCEMAQRSRTKEGLRNRRKVGVVLLCDERGFPLRWDVVPGKRSDHQVMGAMVETIEKCAWVGDAPIVCDRAMGKASTVSSLLRSGLRFLTAVPRNEIESHTKEISWQPFADFELSAKIDPTEDDVEDFESARADFERDVESARQLAESIGMTRVDDTLFVKDLGYACRPLDEAESPWVGPGDLDPEQFVGAASALAWARIFRRILDTKEVKNQAALAAMTGLSRARITDVMHTLRLDEQIQEDLLADKFGHVSDHAMRQVVKLVGAAAQREALEKFAAEQRVNPTGRRFKPRKLRTTETHALRRVVYFNPVMFIHQRLRELKRQRIFNGIIDDINAKARTPRSRRAEESIRFELYEHLSREGRRKLYDISIDERQDSPESRPYLQAKAELVHTELKRRERYNGFVLLVSHRDVPMSAVQLAQLYRHKDVIERDFRLIKSEVELRPLYHRSDRKIRAHVTLCMLALLVKRSLESKLEAAGRPMTADACLCLLEGCDLNRYESNGAFEQLYAVSRPNKEQQVVVRALGLGEMTDNRKVAKRLMPRGSGD